MSVNRLFSSEAVQNRLRDGPLGMIVDDFAALLEEQGYCVPETRAKLRTIDQLNGWLRDRAFGLQDLDEDRYRQFLREAATGLKSPAATGHQLFDWLRDKGLAAPVAAPEIEDARALIEQRYAGFLIDHCGLSANSLKAYVPVVRKFLEATFPTGAVDLGSLSLADVWKYIDRSCRRLSPATTRVHVAALRSFLRYLHQCGDIAGDIADGLVSGPRWRLATIPQAFTPDQVETLLASCDRSAEAGLRDHAILLLLARLGLRACEVVGMTLDDVDWDAGLIAVSGKGGRHDVLPLPHDVGEAMAAYLIDGRPSCPTRSLFVTVKAPRRGFTSSCAIVGVVRAALKRTGIRRSGRGAAHLFRHALATGMLRDGASLEEIGQILRHAHPDSTRIYAKVDLEALRPLAPAWPGEAS